jgi:hypothetical protein
MAAATGIFTVPIQAKMGAVKAVRDRRVDLVTGLAATPVRWMDTLVETAVRVIEPEASTVPVPVAVAVAVLTAPTHRQVVHLL